MFALLHRSGPFMNLHDVDGAAWGRGTYFPVFPLVHSLPHPLLFFTFFLIGFNYVHPFTFYRNSPTPFPGRTLWEATEPGFSLINLCYLYSLVKIDSGVLLYLV